MEEADTPKRALDVVIQHTSLSVDPDLCRRVLENVFKSERVDVELVQLIQADHAMVRRLNRDYLDHDYHTDVLAFPYSGYDEPLEGEIYVDLDTAAQRHGEFGATFEEEVLRYAVHGALHLAGYRDNERGGKEEMRKLENRYLEDAGVL